MAATPIEKSTRFYTVGTTKVLFVPAMADYAAPTRGELDAGTDLTPEVAEFEGWSTTSEPIETPDMVSRFVSTIPGQITAEESSISFYASRTGQDARQLLPRDTTGFVVWMDAGDVEGGTMDVYPVTVSSAPKIRSMENATLIQVTFQITSEPAEDVDIPADGS